MVTLTARLEIEQDVVVAMKIHHASMSGCAVRVTVDEIPRPSGGISGAARHQRDAKRAGSRSAALRNSLGMRRFSKIFTFLESLDFSVLYMF
jgi:hypothetical protein